MRHCPSCGAPVSDKATHCHVDGTQLDERDALRPTELLGATVAGRYRVDRCLGVGGMGAVYVARHLTMDVDVAFKVMLADRINPKTMGRFMREAQAASRIDHDNVVGVLDFGQAERGYYFLVMEYVAGTSLAQELRNTKPFALDRALKILAQVAAGMARTHELGIIHRDLKPENVLLTMRDGIRDYVKIIDFGLAKSLHDEPSNAPLTFQGDVFGTPEYMPPEQWRGEPTDARSDIYAFGVLAYELVTGKLPFEGTLPQLMRGHLELAPAPLGRQRTGVPEPLEKMILGALAKSPEQRIASMHEALSLLSAAIAEQPAASALSFATTLPVPRRVSPDSVPEPTMFDGEALKLAWDAPAFAEELRRLHGLYLRRLAELAGRLWDAQPTGVADGLANARALEQRIAEQADQITRLRAELDRTHQAALAQSARLRAAIIDSSVRLQRLDETLPLEVAERPLSSPERGLPEDPQRRRDAAERLLWETGKRWEEGLGRIASEIGARVRVLQSVLAELSPLLESVSSELGAEGKSRPDLRPLFRELGRIRRAVVAFRAVLDEAAAKD